MDHTHPIDKLIASFRKPIIILALVCAPVSILSYGWMAYEIARTFPLWVSIPVFIAHLMALIGFGCLIDTQQERQSLK